MANLLRSSAGIIDRLSSVQVLLCELIVISKEKFSYFLLSLFKYEFVCSLSLRPCKRIAQRSAHSVNPRLVPCQSASCDCKALATTSVNPFPSFPRTQHHDLAMSPVIDLEKSQFFLQYFCFSFVCTMDDAEEMSSIVRHLNISICINDCRIGHHRKGLSDSFASCTPNPRRGHKVPEDMPHTHPHTSSVPSIAAVQEVE
jgi:hypothetical protein